MSLLDCACIAIIECEQVPQIDEPTSETKVDNEDLITLPPLKTRETSKDEQMNSELDEGQTNQVKRLLCNFREVLTDLPGQTSLAQHGIKTTTTDPIRNKPYPLPYALRETINQEVQDMLQMGIIERSESPYTSPIVLVKKRDGTNRFK